MRITVFHNGDVDDARRQAQRAVEKLSTVNLRGMVEIDGVQKRWRGTTLEFSLYAAVGPFRSLIRGLASVTDKYIILDIELPKLLTALVPEEVFESTVRGLLTS
jgi:Putative polyhydroxyalkanoic acid system protein (PHA_gran_rgn)